MAINWNEALKSTINDLRIRHKTHRTPGSDGESLDLYLADDSPHLRKLKEDLISSRFKPRRFEVKLYPKSPDEPPRAVFVPTNRDYLVARAIKDEISRKLPTPIPTAQQVLRDIIEETSNGNADGLPAKHTNHKRFSSIARLDIKNFFDSIPFHRAVDEMRKEQLVDSHVISIIKLFSRTAQSALDKRQPGPSGELLIALQGLPYSPVIAHWYIERILQQYSTRNESHSLYRYADDLLIFFNKDRSLLRAEWEVEKLKLILRLNGLKVHPFSNPKSKSTHLRNSSLGSTLRFLGHEFMFHGDGIVSHKIPTDRVKAEKTAIWRLVNQHIGNSVSGSFSKFTLKERLNFLRYRLLLRSGGCRYQGNTYGFANYWAYSDETYAFKSLDLYVEKQVKARLQEEHLCNIDDATIGELSVYLDSFRKVRQKGYRPSVAFNFDNLHREKKIEILCEQFHLRRKHLTSVDEVELDLIWHRTLRPQIARMFSSGYSHYI